MKHTMKKFFMPLLALVLTMALVPIPCAFAANTTETTYVEDLGNGITVESTLTVDPMMARSSSKSGTLVSTYKNNGEVIATITLKGTFAYNGSSAGATAASYSKDIASGWNYKNHSLTRSGATVQLTANLTKGVINVPVNMYITCSPDGTLTKG